MSFKSKILKLLALALLAAPASALAQPKAMPIAGVVAAPIGYQAFCHRQPADCPAADDARAPLRLGPGLWSKLNAVNARVNRAVVARTDVAGFGVSDYWQTPLANGRGYGDCEDFVLEKIRALVAAGVPRSALDIALARTPAGELHAVLLVQTQDGEFVLDNRARGVARWDATSYRWVSRQVGGRPDAWVAIG